MSLPLGIEFAVALAAGALVGGVVYFWPARWRWPFRVKLGGVAFYAVAIAFCVVYATLAIRRHDSFHSHAYDMAIYDQIVWNTAHGRLFTGTVMPDVPLCLADHFSPILLALAPLYWVWPDPRGLLIVQVLALAAGGLAVYQWARQRSSDCDSVELGGGLATSVGIGYFLLPPLAWIPVLDFHPSAFLAPLFAWATYFMLRRRYWLFALFVVLALLTREEVGLVVAAFGVYIALAQRRPLLGAAVAVGGLVIFLVIIVIVMPGLHPPDLPYLFNPPPYFHPYATLGSTPSDVVLGVFSRPLDIAARLLAPNKVLLVLHYLVPLALLPLAGWGLSALSLPILASLLLWPAANPAFVESHYGAPIVPFVLFGAIEGCRRVVAWVGRRREAAVRRGLSAAVLTCSLLAFYLYGPGPFTRVYDTARYTDTARATVGREVVATIPAEARVMAQTDLAPHLSQREVIYMLPWIFDMDAVDHVVLDTQGNDWPLEAPEGAYERYVARLLADAEWQPVLERDGYLVLRRAPPQMTTFPTPARFDGTIELVGYAVEAKTATDLELVLYWRALAPPAENYTAFVHLLDAQGRRLTQADAEPTGLIYRTSNWEVGKLVRGRHNLKSATAIGEDCHIEVGLYLLRMMQRLPLEGGGTSVRIPIRTG